MEKDQEPPFPRDPWQRLLQDRGDAPPETTDARIRAAARKALTPKLPRWWVPASLAATVLLAVVIVQSQYGSERKRANLTESDYAVSVIMDLPPAAESPPPSPALESSADSAAPERRESAPTELHYNMAPQDLPEEPAVEAEEEELGEVAATGSRIRGPEQELKAASEPEAEKVEQAVEPRAAAPMQSSAPSAITGGAIAPQPAAKLRAPEAWYEDIVALRKAGRIEEADAELTRFEASYPDWLKQHKRSRP